MSCFQKGTKQALENCGGGGGGIPTFSFLPKNSQPLEQIPVSFRCFISKVNSHILNVAITFKIISLKIVIASIFFRSVGGMQVVNF